MSASSGDPGQVVVFGSLNADLTVRVERFPEPGETLTGSELVTAPGGKSSNQAVAAATLGSAVRLIGAVGDDAHGTFLLDQAAEAGVDVSGVARDADHATGSAMIVVDAGGENTIIVSPGANGTHTAESVSTTQFDSAGPFYSAGQLDSAGQFDGADILCLCLEVPLPAVHKAAQEGHEAGAQVLLNLSPYAEVPARLLAAVDVLVVNRTEAAQVLGATDLGEDWWAILDGFVELGVDRVVVTLGADGAAVLDATAPNDIAESENDAESEVGGEEKGEARAGRVTILDAPTVQAVDTTGCGDAFMGAVAHGLAAGSSLVEAARLAAQVGALAATREGAQASYRAFAHLNTPPETTRQRSVR